MYKVVFTDKAIKTLKKLDKSVSKMIFAWIRKNLENCENPRSQGKSLVGNYSGMWRYKVGDYRIITEISDEEVLIYVVNVGHRKNIY